MNAIRGLFFALCIALALPSHAFAQGSDPCPRPATGSEVTPPPDLFSANGVLDVDMNYFTTVDKYSRTLFCFVTPDGMESPTLHVNPGDEIRISLTNKIPSSSAGAAETVSGSKKRCGSTTMTAQSVNMHFHGTNVSPACHSDEVIHTLVNPGETFQYVIKIPKDEPPGLYWYHPHVHGIASPAVQGGASGVIEVEGIANIQPAVAGLPERFLVIRDQPLAHKTQHKKLQPFWDISLNYVPISYPKYQPSIIKMNPGVQEFWRVTNASADTIMDLKLVYDGQAQSLGIVALDGVPTGSQDGKRQGTIVTQKDILIPPAGRAEFIVTGPSSSVKSAVFETEKIDTGPAGDVDTKRPLAQIVTTASPTGLPRTQERNGPPNVQRFEGLADAKVTATRNLYFYELIIRGGLNSNAPPPWGGLVDFYITVDGQKRKLFDPNERPAIITTQGAVEDWTIENRTEELHEFHMHQIHFLVLAVNGVPIPKRKQQFYDTFQVPYWTGHGHYPSITVRMDFRGADIGDFVYHCHILDHEDAGMMAIIRVLPKT
jgi:FtsP/CotA-like multicopper oxidase with cupredoxin domain